MTTKEILSIIKNVREDETVSINELITVLKICDDVYYNNGEETPKRVATFIENKVTDKVYDMLIDYLRERRPKHSYLKKIGAPVSNASSRKVKLPFHMGSLNKIKPNTKALSTFLAKGGPFVVSDKVDGVSLGIIQRDKLLYTRGDGKQGQDISHLWNILSLPNTKDNLQIRAEIVMPISSFNSFLKKNPEAKNARNTVSGLVNKASTDKAFAKTKVITYQIIGMKPSQALTKLKSLGYNVPWFKVVNNLTEEQLSKFLVERKANAKYEIDGLVVSRDVAEKVTSGNPKNSMAFKSEEVETKLEFTVEDVEWNLSKHGLFKPTIIFKPQILDGVTIKRASGFNAKFIVDNSIGKGSVVIAKRSGGVIPHIISVVKKARKPLLPTEEYEWNESQVDIMSVDTDNSDSVKILRMTEFLKAIGVERVKQGLIEKLYYSGINSIKKLLTVSKSKLLLVEGIQDKTATLIYSQIQTKKENIYLPNLLFGSGCFPRTLGVKRLEQIVITNPSFMKTDKEILLEKIKDMEGFNSKTASDFMSGLLKFKKFYKLVENLIHISMPKKVKAKTEKLSGKTFVFTGFRDKELEERIVSNGGIVSNSINSKTTMLVVKDINSSSSKMNKAENLNIKVKDRATFTKWINTLLK